MMVILLSSGCSLFQREIIVEKANAKILPDIAGYSEKTQKAAAKEVKYCLESNKCPIIAGVFVPDYIKSRDQNRAARAKINAAKKK